MCIEALRFLNDLSFLVGSENYLALFTDAGAEVTGYGYARVCASGVWRPISFTEFKFSNRKGISFPTSKNKWGDVNELRIFDQPEGGRELCRIALDFTQTITAGVRVFFKPGSITFDIT